ncbi:MAG: hypothetical protein ABI563_08225 [Specibacter sp.]
MFNEVRAGRTLRNLLFKSRGDGKYKFNDWPYGQQGDGVPSVDVKSAKALAH